MVIIQVAIVVEKDSKVPEKRGGQSFSREKTTSVDHMLTICSQSLLVPWDQVAVNRRDRRRPMQ